MNGRADKEQKHMLAVRFAYTAGLGLLTLLFLILYLHFSYGWFAKNDAVTGEGMQVSAQDESFFELAVRQRGAAAGDDLDQRTPYADDSLIIQMLGREEYGGYEKLGITSNEHAAIFCHLVNENPHEENSEDLAPGAYGYISFDIALTGSCDCDFDIDLSFFPLGVTTGGIPTPIVDPDETDPDVTAEQEALLAELRDLLSGHVLFYRSRSALVNGGYYYADRLIDDSFVFELPATPDYTADGKNYYTVNIYWIWPATFGQLALPNGDERVHTHSVYNNETERGEILTFISANPDRFFRGLEGNNNFQSSGGRSWEDLNFIALSEGYNRADQLIGDKTQFLIVCVDVGQHGASS